MRLADKPQEPIFPSLPLQKLHLAEDSYHFQVEEIHALRKEVGEREQECQRLRAERARGQLLVHGLKRELAAHRHKVGDGSVWVKGGERQAWSALSRARFPLLMAPACVCVNDSCGTAT